MRSLQHPCHTNRYFDRHSIKEEDKAHKARKLVIEMVLGHDTPITEKGKTTKTTITSTDVPLMDIL